MWIFLLFHEFHQNEEDIEAHESGSHVEVIGEIEDNGKRKKLMTAESFSIID